MNDAPKPSAPHPLNCVDRRGRRLPSHTRFLTAFGETLPMAEWSRRNGVAVPTMIRRLAKGWPIERAVTAGDGRVVHRQAPRGRPSPEYRVWASMVMRCENPAVRSFPQYGGRGIRVYPAWRLSFEAFLADVGPRPEGTTLDRIDGEGHYEPGNVRWATKLVQANNTRANIRITFRGVTRTRAEWAREVGLTYTALRQRLDAGWPVEAALTLPSGSRRPR